MIKEIGIETFAYETFEPDIFIPDTLEYDTFEPDEFKPDRLDIKFLRRGVIGIAKIGYIEE